jgi:hypothetical protein
MANDQKQNNSVASAEDLLQEMKQRAEDAHKANDVFMLGVMTELIKVASPIVTKAVARHHREERARINEMHRELRQQNRSSSGGNRED